MTIVDDDGVISETVPEFVVLVDNCFVVSTVSAYVIRGTMAPTVTESTASRLVIARVFIEVSSFARFSSRLFGQTVAPSGVVASHRANRISCTATDGRVVGWVGCSSDHQGGRSCRGLSYPSREPRWKAPAGSYEVS